MHLFAVVTPHRHRRWFRDTAGQNLIEYALLAAFISVATLSAATTLGHSFDDWYQAIAGIIGSEQPAESGGGSGKKSNCSATGMVASRGKCGG